MIKLNLGSGDDYIDGYINVDLYAEKADERFDVATLPYDDNTVDEIRAYHVIEHFDYMAVQYVLKEWLRVLKPNGKIKIETPDFLESCREFVNTDLEGRWKLYGHFFSTAWVNPGFIHKFLFTESELVAMMQNIGFRNVVRTPADSGYVWQHTNKNIFLNVEATK